MPDEAATESLTFHFASLTDPRVKRTQAHGFEDILMLSLCALLCGAESFVEFESFGKAKIEFLSTFLKLPNGIPSHDTFGRVFAALDSRQFAECFADTLKNEVLPPEQIFDPKVSASRSLFDYLETFYNPTRLHSSLNYQSPENFLKEFFQNQKPTLN
jgi:hypothetical protein